uniref:Protein kinase domain-containing protein n=1 Tax=Hanusia phi TaxID=3032 RepID=A0A7S0EW96_9CRYP|mmetsp:Transcript_3194/g.7680  ORF Transcript_3194/g.7680 Transcript_3194/m.7680 type:complete len:429 (+) Transcript_3194:219-1505(+)
MSSMMQVECKHVFLLVAILYIVQVDSRFPVMGLHSTGRAGSRCKILRLRGGEEQRRVQDDFIMGETQSLQSLQIGDVIGFGSFSTVHAGIGDGEIPVAVKRTRINSDDVVNLKRIEREISILGSLKHRNVVKLLHVMKEKGSHGEEVVSLVLERCLGGELFDFVNDFQTFHANGDRSWRRSNTTEVLTVKEEHIVKIIYHILVAVEYLHSQHVVHRDLKLENVMFEEPFNVDKEPVVKLIDFGFSREFGNERDMFTACGSTLYIAPEVLMAKETGLGYSSECDLWAVGVMSFILLCCKPPFSGPTSYDIGCAIKSGNYSYPDYALVSDEAKDFIAGLLELNPSKRLTARQALEHAWIRRYVPQEDEGWGRRIGKFLAVPRDSSKESCVGLSEGWEVSLGKWLRHMVPHWRASIRGRSKGLRSRVPVAG